MSLLYGVHDREGRHIVPAGGWIVDTIALSDNPAPTDYAALRGDINWLVRVNWGYGSTGTIPLPEGDALYRDRLAHYVHNSRGVHAYIIGNEPNHEQERPDGVYITPERYARFFVDMHTLIKTIDPNARVIPASCAPYHANPMNWLDYWREMLGLIEQSGGCDGIAVHAYTRSSDPADIGSGAVMGGVLGVQASGFYTYFDALDAVPGSMQRLPAYITEFNELLPDGWDDRNTGVVQAAYADIDHTNREHLTDHPIQCLILYRWPKFDQWHIEGKQGVIDDFQAAIGRGYQSPPVMGANSVSQDLHLPYTPNESPTVTAPALPPREWDERLTQRGVSVVTPDVKPGEQFFRVTKARWYSEQEAQGKHNIYANILDSFGNPTGPGLSLVVQWPGDSALIYTEAKPGDEWKANYAMSPSRNEFSISVNDGLAPSETLTGIGMGEDTPEGFNPGAHTSTGVTFQLVTMPQAEQPEPPKVEPPQAQPPVPVPAGIIEPRVAQAILQVESRGAAFGNGGRVLIRFEAHIFGSQLGNDALWAEHFRVDADRPWVNQMWRPGPGHPWRTIHTGSQDDEWAAFLFARNLNADAAHNSISMGAPQIVGFNHARIGYPSAAVMFKAFESEPMQIIGFINFFLGDPILTDAARRKDWRIIAARYNGAGNVDAYAKLLQQAYERIGA